jgi:hypothetical protein
MDTNRKLKIRVNGHTISAYACVIDHEIYACYVSARQVGAYDLYNLCTVGSDGEWILMEGYDILKSEKI